MARIDDFKNALALTQKMFGEFDPETIAENSGAGIKKNSPKKFQLNLRMFSRDYKISWPKGIIEMLSQGKEPSVPEQVLLMRYLVNAKNIPVNETDITFRQVPGGDSYFPAFIKRAQGPMTNFFGANPTLLHKTGIEIGGKKSSEGDISIYFDFFPKVPIRLVIWEGDDEFTPEGSILFDETIIRHMSAEDIAVMSGIVVFTMIGLAKTKL